VIHVQCLRCNVNNALASNWTLCMMNPMIAKKAVQ
jgi:hypothetical protein